MLDSHHRWGNRWAAQESRRSKKKRRLNKRKLPFGRHLSMESLEERLVLSSVPGISIQDVTLLETNSTVQAQLTIQLSALRLRRLQACESIPPMAPRLLQEATIIPLPDWS